MTTPLRQGDGLRQRLRARRHGIAAPRSKRTAGTRSERDRGGAHGDKAAVAVAIGLRRWSSVPIRWCGQPTSH